MPLLNRCWLGLALLLITASLDARVSPGGTLVGATDLLYQGAFRVPAGTHGSSSFEYGGTALAFNAARGSLFIVGHSHHQNVAEISVPAVRTATDLSALDTAAILQPFTDATEGTLAKIGAGDILLGGLLPYDGRLYVSAYIFYDASKSQTLSHFVSSTDLKAQGDVQGPFRVGTNPAGFHSGYFGVVPAAWRTALGGPVLNGNCCLSIISRTSYGPAAFAIDPATIGMKAHGSAIPLLYYPSSDPLLERGDHGDGWSNTSELFNGTTEIKGLVFPEGTRSVLFFGRQGVGPFCYGESADCKDPAETYKGTHAYPYRYQVWAYDANDLTAVKNGSRRPWSVRPYAVWTFSLPFAEGHARINGAAYDPASGRIFLSQAHGDRPRPVIHVFTIKGT